MFHRWPIWLKWFSGLIAVVVVPIGLIILWNKLEYFTPHPLIAHNRVSMTLPFDTENEATNLIPMGETIAHNFYGGHPGIDFQWDHSVPLIAVADGKVTSITKADDMGESVLDLTLQIGDYLAIYKELDSVAVGIKEGSSVKKGDVIAYPHCHVNIDRNGTKRTGCQVHWEFGYNMLSPGFDRLCPLTYFDAEASKRINAIWAAVPANDQFKRNAPDICSNIYHGLDQ